METEKTSKIIVKDPILKRLLRGGFNLPNDKDRGLIILIRGKPGTGKSTFALQLLDMMESETAKKYCTLEQSTQDLKFKLASMLVAQAIHAAKLPDFTQNKIICSAEIFRDHIKGKLVKCDTTFWGSVDGYLKKIEFELYNEPSADIREKCEEAEYDLADLIQEKLDPRHIEIRDVSYAEGVNETHHDGPLGGFRSRVILASRMIEKLDTHRKGPEQNRTNLPIIVVDGLSLLSLHERETLELQRIVERLRRCCQLGILVYEPNENETPYLDHHADFVIELERRTMDHPLEYLIHEMSIRKTRYQEAALGQHQFKIRSSGLAFFPSLHFQVHHYEYMDLENKRSSYQKDWKPNFQKKDENACKEGSLLDMIFNPKPGESIVLLGSRNSFKTQICLDFLACGCWGCWHESRNPKSSRDPEKGLLISLIDNAPDLERGLYCPWYGSKKKIDKSDCHFCTDEESTLITHARTFCQRPGCITPAEFFHYIKERIDPSSAKKEDSVEAIRRLVFWDLTQIDYRFPLFKEDKMLLPALMDFFKTKQLKSLFMGAGNAENTKPASAMADHVVFCWRSPYKPEGPFKTQTLSSLMLYVDRTPAYSSRPGKNLYCFPVFPLDQLLIPRTQAELENNLLEDLSGKENEYDKKMVERITNMQAVQ